MSDMIAGVPAGAVSIWRIEPHADHVTLWPALAIACEAARSHKGAAACKGAFPTPH